MTALFFRVYRSGERVPSNFLGKVHATSAEEAIRMIAAQPAYKGRGIKMTAYPSHERKIGK